MRKKPNDKECITNKSAFNYTLVLKPDGTVKVKDKCGNLIKGEGSKKLPPIKKSSIRAH